MARKQIAKEIYKERILKSFQDNKSLSSSMIQIKSKIGYLQMMKLINELVSEGKLIEKTIKIKRKEYSIAQTISETKADLPSETKLEASKESNSPESPITQLNNLSNEIKPEVTNGENK